MAHETMAKKIDSIDIQVLDDGTFVVCYRMKEKEGKDSPMMMKSMKYSYQNFDAMMAAMKKDFSEKTEKKADKLGDELSGSAQMKHEED